MNGRPDYFDAIRERAARRWDQLEGDPELAGPWHQLFKQVQSPRHILSELLQNADDAGATEAAVRIQDRRFIFTHNGEDFTEEHFASLCRFGYSNKRALHTIGFRGIGFKSTFSLGGSVHLLTPTLSVLFERHRFTEPKWTNGASPPPNHTEIRVSISDAHREKEVEKNLQEWLKSPVSLLFFRHIRCLRIADHEMHWGSLGPGPVPDTEWMALHDTPDDAFLVARSAAEAFPPEALSEIKQERLLSIDQDADFPPCKVEIVLGAAGRLYVVLPTGVETALPFACNAPFIQDPARLKIKDPETSPTNRWLLERVGALAASVMLQWLGDTSTSLVERSRAYGLFPDVDRDDNSLEGTCATTVEEAFDDALDNQAFLLTNEGELKFAKQSIVYPGELFDVWRAEQIGALFDSNDRPALSQHIAETDREKLVRWGVVERVTKDNVLAVLQSKHLPRPESWRRLLNLWAYVAPDVTGWRMTHVRSKLRIVPAQGKNVLYSAAEVVRLAEKRLLQSEADWEFLSAHLLVLNQNWPRFISEQRRSSEAAEDTGLDQETTAAAQAVLKALGLEDSSDVSKVIDQVAAAFFAQESKSLSDCVQLAQIAAKLGAMAGDSFRFVTHDLRLRSRGHVVVFDQDGTLEHLLPKSWSTEHLLHPDYAKSFTSCTAEEWRRWVGSGRSGLLEFAPLKQRRIDVYGRQRIEAELRKRGSSSSPTFHYKTSSFIIEDWDFDDTLWQHWTVAAKEDDRIWGRVLGRILGQPDSFWSSADSARALQIATTGSTRAITYDSLLPAWILKFRNLPCLPDARGFLRKPGEMLLWTPETVSLIDVEFFVDKLLDRETTRPLLTLLGVRDTPTGPDRLLDCLRSLAQSQKPPTAEVEKWYRRLDQMVDTCSTTDLLNIKKAFRQEKIILTEGAGWATVSGVYLSSDEEDVPGAAIVRASVRDLALWGKVGVLDRPTADLAIQWLKELPTGKPLSQDEARRVRFLMARHANRIWNECGHWLNLAREWVPVTTLEYALTMQTLTEYGHLHEWVKQKTADLRLPAETTEAPPFSNVPRLASRIEERFHQNPLFPGTPEKQLWLNRFGTDLCRVELDDNSETQRIRILADDLANTMWRTTPTLEIIPYINGSPAGTPKRAEVVWLDRVLYVEQLPKAKLARLVPERLAKSFGRPDVAAALNYCFGRSIDDVTEYLEENFKLVPEAATSKAGDEAEIPREQQMPAKEETGRDDTPEETVAPELTDSGAEPTEAEATEGELDGVDTVRTKDRPPPKSAKPSIIERFARSQGFQKDSDDRFFHADGSWIGRAHDDRFPWEQRTAKGELVRHYWPKDHCLELQPLQIDADIWGLIDKFPDIYALILATPQGDPIEVPGARLLAMREVGELVLYPASYRLVHRDEDRP